MQNNKPSRADSVIAALIALSMLSLLAPFPRPRAVSETPWFMEVVSTAVLAGIFAFHAIRDSGFIGRLFTVRDPLTRWIVRLMAVFASWGLLSAAWATSAWLPVHHALLWGEYILVFLYFRERLSAAHDYRLVAYIFALVAAMLGVLAIIEYATLPDFTVLEGVIRLRYGAYSELLVTILPVLAALGICAGRTKGRLMLSAAATLGWATVMLSLSKGAFIAGIVGFAITFGCIILFAAQYRRRAFVSFAVWLVLTIGVQVGFSILSPIPATVDYISGKADVTRGTALARVFVWKIGAQMAAQHPFVGVGSDNFGISFNNAREHYRLGHSADPPDEPVSDNLVVRAHNELLQVTAELGIVGLVLFLAPFAVLVWAFARSFSARKNFPPVLWAAFGGMAAFFVSSMVSSFSFRLAQNGIAFFIVFALAAVELRKLRGEQDEAAPAPAAAPRTSFAGVILPVYFLLSLVTLGSKGYAERCVLDAGREPDIEKAAGLYEKAVRLDPAYASAYLQRSGRYYGTEDFARAAVDLRKSIGGGCGVVLTYSALAASFEKSGQPDAADIAFNEALRIYPRSVFLRVRYSRFLADIGRQADSATQFEIARDIDKRQADGWANLFSMGSVRAFYAARENPELAAPVELRPEAAVLEYLDKPMVEPPQ